MATSQQWRHAGLLVTATLVVLFIGSADAWGCPKGFKGCDPHREGCETSIKNDVYNCGDCNRKCKTWLPYTTAKCSDGYCDYDCKYGWANCDGTKHEKGCNKDIHNDIHNCGGCGNECHSSLKDGEAICSYGHCKEQCKKGWKYDDAKKCCVKY